MPSVSSPQLLQQGTVNQLFDIACQVADVGKPEWLRPGTPVPKCGRRRSRDMRGSRVTRLYLLQAGTQSKIQVIGLLYIAKTSNVPLAQSTKFNNLTVHNQSTL